MAPYKLIDWILYANQRHSLLDNARELGKKKEQHYKLQDDGILL